MLTAIRQWVIKTMMKGNTGVVQTMPKQQIIEMNVQITAHRMMQNGINPNDLKTVGQVENVINQIEQPRVNVNPGMTSVKKADVLDMEGNKIPEGSGIMAGEEIKNLSGELTSVPNKSGQSGLSYETKNKEAIQRLKDKKNKLDDPEEKADGGRIGLLAGSVPKIPAVISALLKNKKKVNQAVNNIFPTGDYKLDAEMVAESIVELNPKPFDNMLYDDLNDVTRSEVYGAALSGVNQQNALMLQIKKATRPEKTLQSMKEGKGINMSDPEIAKEFARFMKQTDPKGTKDIEEKILLESFDPKRTKGNADGGRIGYFMGSPYPKGAAALRELLKFFGKKSDSVKNPSDILRIVNPKQFNKTLEDPRIYGKFDVEKGIGAPDMIKNLQKKMTSDRQSTVKEMLDAAKNIKTADNNTIRYKNNMIKEMIDKGVDRKMAEEMAETISRMAEDATGKFNTPKLSDEGILQLENILKNMETGGKKPRDLNADGGRIGLRAGMTKRAFLKLMGGVGLGIGAIKSGILGISKGAGKTVAKELTSVPIGNPEGMPVWFKPLINKIIKEGDDVTKKFGTVDREIVHTKKIDNFEEVTVYQDLNTGNVRVEYGPHLTDDTGKVIRASNEPEVIQLEYKAPEIIEPNISTGKSGGKTKEEFSAMEAEPEVVNWEGDIEMSGENVVNKVEDLITDTSKLQKYATDNKLTIKELSDSMKKQKFKKKLDSDPMEQVNYIENKQGMNAMDYIDEGKRVGDFDPKGYQNYDTKGMNLYDGVKRSKKANGGLAYMLGE